VINVKWSAVAGGIGFILSLLVGLISGVDFPSLLIRAFVFAVIFFAFAAVIWFLINNFIPELLSPQTEEAGEIDNENGDFPSKFSAARPGSRVNISVDDGQGVSLPSMYQNSGSDDEIGNISDLLEGKIQSANLTENINPNDKGMDWRGENGYNANSVSVSQADNVLPEDSEGDLPNLDAIGGGFSSSEEEAAPALSIRTEPERKPSGNKAQKMEGDFDAKSLAAGIRTILTKE
jgi:hypothetical protein